MPNLLSRQLDKEGSIKLENILKNKGLNLLVDKCVESIKGENKVTNVVFKDGSLLEADMVIFSIGVRSNIQIVKDTDIKTNRGILVDKYMNTSSKDIYACGDVAEIDSIVWAIWPAAIDMGKIAGANACGDKLEFKIDNYPVGLDVFETKIFSIGNIKDNDGCISLNNKENYKKLFFEDDLLVGAIFINDLSKNVKVMNLMSENATMNEVLKSNIL